MKSKLQYVKYDILGVPVYYIPRNIRVDKHILTEIGFKDRRRKFKKGLFVIATPNNTYLIRICEERSLISIIAKRRNACYIEVEPLNFSLPTPEPIIFNRLVNAQFEIKGRILERYKVYPYIIFIVENEDKRFYMVGIQQYFKRIRNTISLIIEEVRKELTMENATCTMRFSELIEELLKRIKRKLMSLGIHKPDVLQDVSIYITFNVLNLGKFAPFMLDDRINEFYVDAPLSTLYLDHEDYGRCVSNIEFSKGDLEALLIHVKREKGKVANVGKPSLKGDLNTRYFKLRISFDLKPLVPEGPALDVRKHKIKPFTIERLILKRFIPLKEAAYLIFALKQRANIIITGEPNSGKTTLANALLLHAPKSWRRIFIEDVEEFQVGNQELTGLKLNVSTYEEEVYDPSKRRSKLHEIIKLLHRSPDYVAINEIQSKEHSIALFNALSAGIRCIATCHAPSVEGLIYRWIREHGISKEEISLIDIIVYVRRRVTDQNIRRYVEVIAEPIYDGQKLSLTKVYLNLKNLTTSLALKERPFIKKLLDKGLSEAEIIQEFRQTLKILFERCKHEISILQKI